MGRLGGAGGLRDNVFVLNVIGLAGTLSVLLFMGRG